MNPNTLSPLELNALISTMPTEDGTKFAYAKEWQRVDVGKLETYVGDRLYVITLVEKLPETMDEVEANGLSAEETVIRYLQGEGFIDEEFVYVGLQRFDLQNPPRGLDNE